MKHSIYVFKSLTILLVWVLLSSYGCSEGGNTEYAGALQEEAATKRFSSDSPSQIELTNPAVPAELSAKKIIKDGNITLKSKNIWADKMSLDTLLVRYKAYYESEDLQNYEYSTSYTLKVRIQASGFEKFISDIEKLPIEVSAKNTQNRDVTEEYVDIESRLSSKKAYLAKYKELLSKAKSIAEILEVEEKIRIIQEEIESFEGRKKYLLDQVAYSTLTVYISQNKDYQYKPVEQDNFWERIKSSFNSGWVLLVELILGVFSLWPLALIVPAVIWLVRKLRNRKKSSS